MIYLDSNATTPMAPEVRAAMLPFLDELFANPSSPHDSGRAVRRAVEAARAAVAGLLGAMADEIMFTGSATEANHAAILGSLAESGDRRRVVASSVEHPGILLLLRELERRGHPVTLVPVDRCGRLRLDALAAAVTPDTAVVSVMWANNETGTIMPVAEAGTIARAAGARFHCDATQAVGRVAIDLGGLPIDLLTLSAHKFHGPKGIGALVVRRGTALAPLIHGHQERRRRGGTENVLGIAGLGAAARLAAEGLAAGEGRAIATLRDRLESGILSGLAGALVNGPVGDSAGRLPNTVNIRFTDAGGRPIDAEGLLIHLDRLGIQVSLGAACAGGGREPSHVLLAQGLTPAEAMASLRFSLNRTTSGADIERVLDQLGPLHARLAA
ncbi:MAG: aminotransferase class V-fold PLP-dependent enzyme [Azospirillum sp.]|nr:aminotransferase class V-fold PLP-dependent enzyme [Azospirillum sp.]